MNIKITNYNPEKFGVKFLQEGGEISQPQEAPMQEAPAQEDPMMQLIQAAAQAVQTNDANLALQVCNQLVQLASGGNEQPPQEAPGEPVYRKGGRLVRYQ